MNIIHFLHNYYINVSDNVLPEDITVDHKDELVSVEASVPDAQDDVTELFTVEQ